MLCHTAIHQAADLLTGVYRRSAAVLTLQRLPLCWRTPTPTCMFIRATYVCVCLSFILCLCRLFSLSPAPALPLSAERWVWLLQSAPLGLADVFSPGQERGAGYVSTVAAFSPFSPFALGTPGRQRPAHQNISYPLLDGCRAAARSSRVLAAGLIQPGSLPPTAKQMLWRWRRIHRQVSACRADHRDIFW